MFIDGWWKVRHGGFRGLLAFENDAGIVPSDILKSASEKDPDQPVSRLKKRTKRAQSRKDGN